MSYHFFNDLYAYLKSKWWGKPFVILLVIMVFLFTVWNSFPDSTKEWFLGGSSSNDNKIEKPVELVSASFNYRRILNEQELNQMEGKWGYKFDVMHLLDNNGKPTFQYGLPFRLIGLDINSKQYYPHINAITVEEFNTRVKEILGTDAVLTPVKEYGFNWTLQNVDEDKVSDLRIRVDTRMPDSGHWGEGIWSQPMEIKGGKKIVDTSILTSPIYDVLPNQIDFRVNLEYKNNLYTLFTWLYIHLLYAYIY